MTKKFALCLAGAICAVWVSTASAQGLLPPREIAVSVRSMGLTPTTTPVFRNGRYVLRAIDGRGVEVRVVADAVDGRVLAVRPFGYRQGPVYAGRADPLSGYPVETVPPRGYERMTPPPGSYERAARGPSEPSVIYAPGSRPAPPTAKPAARPVAPKVAARPAKPAEAKPAQQSKAAEEKPASAKPEESRSAEIQPAETKPAEIAPTEAKAAGDKGKPTTTGAAKTSSRANAVPPVPPVQTFE